MDMLKLLDQVRNKKDIFESARVIEFTGKQYPLLFFSVLIQQMASNSASTLEMIDLDAADEMIVHSKLSTSFLGMHSAYWMRSLSDLDKKSQQRWIGYLQQYAGPNCVLFFVEGESVVTPSDGVISIALPEQLDAKACIALMQGFGYPVSPAVQKFVGDIYKKTGTLNLDDSCLMMRYSSLVGAGAPDFLENWLDKLVVSQQSLFTLSQHFFAKNSRAFFALWHKIGPQYGEMFWVVFWSEQLWRAYQYVRFIEQGNRVEARTIGYRLPFSFLQRDWQELHESELKHAHQFMYSVDYWFKNGGNTTLLEVMYLNFFTGNFVGNSSVRSIEQSA